VGGVSFVFVSFSFVIGSAFLVASPFLSPSTPPSFCISSISLSLSHPLITRTIFLSLRCFAPFPYFGSLFSRRARFHFERPLSRLVRLRTISSLHLLWPGGKRVEREKSGREEDALVKKKGELNAEGEDVTSGGRAIGNWGTSYVHRVLKLHRRGGRILSEDRDEKHAVPFLSLPFPGDVKKNAVRSTYLPKGTTPI